MWRGRVDCTMDYSKLIVSIQKEESIGMQSVKQCVTSGSKPRAPLFFGLHPQQSRTIGPECPEALT